MHFYDLNIEESDLIIMLIIMSDHGAPLKRPASRELLTTDLRVDRLLFCSFPGY